MQRNRLDSHAIEKRENCRQEKKTISFLFSMDEPHISSREQRQEQEEHIAPQAHEQEQEQEKEQEQEEPFRQSRERTCANSSTSSCTPLLQQQEQQPLPHARPQRLPLTSAPQSLARLFLVRLFYPRVIKQVHSHARQITHGYLQTCKIVARSANEYEHTYLVYDPVVVRLVATSFGVVAASFGVFALLRWIKSEFSTSRN